MNKQVKELVSVSALILLFLFLTMTAFMYVYGHYDINIYKNIIIFLIAITAAAASITVGMLAAFFITFHRKYAGPALSKFVKLGLNTLIPIAEFISGLIKIDKDAVRNFYIAINNIIVQSKGHRYSRDQILVLLPHCLQNSECKFKVTSDIRNCIRCGKCSIGDLSHISENKGVDIRVVTGGTAARNIIAKSRPGLILSVACERDLASGISDVRKIPVLGMINDRPNGPCNNTNIDIKVFGKILDDVIEEQ